MTAKLAPGTISKLGGEARQVSGGVQMWLQDSFSYSLLLWAYRRHLEGDSELWWNLETAAQLAGANTPTQELSFAD